MPPVSRTYGDSGRPSAISEVAVYNRAWSKRLCASTSWVYPLVATKIASWAPATISDGPDASPGGTNLLITPAECPELAASSVSTEKRNKYRSAFVHAEAQ
jgi:hypothetical protein